MEEKETNNKSNTITNSETADITNTALFDNAVNEEFVKKVISTYGSFRVVPQSYNKEKMDEPSPDIKIIHKEDRMMLSVMTRYEYARVVARRAAEIEDGSTIFITNILNDPIEIAKEEIRQKKCPLSILRMHNNDEGEIWDVNELAIP